MENGELIGDGKYTINTIENVKDYYISQINYSGDFGTKDVLCSTGEGNERFYLMALTDFNPGIKYCWYYEAVGKISDYYTTSINFGTGKQNTLNMIEKWNNKEYGAQDIDKYNKDVWGQIQTKVNEGWFLPSRGEWSAFAEELEITARNYMDKSLSASYWSSSIDNETTSAYSPTFSAIGRMSEGSVNCLDNVRLSTTF